MIAVGYFDGTHRRGLLVFAQGPDGVRALGGFDPGDPAGVADPNTVVTTDVGERTLAGWAHPDDLAECQGRQPTTAEDYARMDHRRAEIERDPSPRIVE